MVSRPEETIPFPELPPGVKEKYAAYVADPEHRSLLPQNVKVAALLTQLKQLQHVQRNRSAISLVDDGYSDVEYLTELEKINKGLREELATADGDDFVPAFLRDAESGECVVTESASVGKKSEQQPTPHALDEDPELQDDKLQEFLQKKRELITSVNAGMLAGSMLEVSKIAQMLCTEVDAMHNIRIL